MHSHSACFARHAGQIAPVALFGLVVASTVLAVMFNTSQKITEKSRVANAADAAAYSGAVWTARHLNFLAYTNRAMIANHIAVGHFVSYVSWIRYVDDSIDYVDDVAKWIPYVGQYVDMVQQIAGEVRAATEQSARVAIPALEHWNATLRAAQLETQASLVSDQLQDLMSRTASAYDPAIHINDVSDWEGMPDPLRVLLESRVTVQLAAVPGFIQRFANGADQSRMSELVARSMQTDADLWRWIQGNRGWQENLLAVQLRKRGLSSVAQGASLADWRAADDIQYRKREFSGWQRWMLIGDQTSTASAREFASDYSGVPVYYNVAGSPSERSLPIVAIASRRSSHVAALPRSNAALDFPIAVAALARVEFRRPAPGAVSSLSSHHGEYANLFNPFWEAHLAPMESVGESR